MRFAQTVTVSIGRNVGVDDLLSLSEWDSFRDTVYSTLARYGEVTFDTTGKSCSSYGQEESYTVGAEVPSEADAYAALDEIEPLAREYRQEAIAVTIGTTYLVG